MKSRSFLSLCFSLLLLCAQQMAFAGALEHVQKTAFDQQCAYDEGDTAVPDLSKHFSIDEYDDAAMPAFGMPTLVDFTIVQNALALSQRFLIAPSHYFSRAPPLS